MPNGNFLFRTRPHPIILIGYALLALVFEVALLIFASHAASIPVVLGPLLVLAVLALDYSTTIYEATTEAVVKRQGFPWLREEQIPLREVQDLKFRAGILGRLFGFGTLEVESAGTQGTIVLEALPTSAYRRLRPVRRVLDRTA